MTNGLGRRAVLAAGAAAPLIIPRARAQPAATLTIGLVNYPPNIRPWENTGSSQAAVKLALHRTLVSYDTEGRLRPELAEEWRQETPTALYFKLREGIRFHNGDALRAEDVKYTLETIPAARSTAYLRAEYGVIDKVEVLNAREFRVLLKEPSAPFPHLLASYHAPIVSAKGMAADANAPAGLGPFMLEGIDRGSGVTVRRFDQYYRPGLPRLARIRFQAYADENLRSAALEAGDVQMVEGVPWQKMEALEKNPRVRLDSVVGPFMYLVFNVRSGPFADPRLRRAVAHAIRREDIVRIAHFGRGEILEGLPLSGPLGRSPANKLWPYDPAKAKELMAAAGHPNGFTATLLSTSSPTLHTQTAEVVQANLREVGIQVELQLPDWPARVQLGNRGQFQFGIMGSVGAYNDPDSIQTFISGPPAYPRSFGFESARIQELLLAGRQETDPQKRTAIYEQLMAVSAEEVPIVGLSWRAQAFGLQRNVTGFRNLPGPLTFYSPITLEETAIG